jgi:hypothetical protein
MIQIKVTHPKHPTDATAQAVNCLNRKGVNNQVDGEEISIVDPAQFDSGYASLMSAGFAVSFAGTYARYSD